MLHQRVVPIDGHSKFRFGGSLGYGDSFRCPDGCGHLLKTPFSLFILLFSIASRRVRNAFDICFFTVSGLIPNSSATC